MGGLVKGILGTGQATAIPPAPPPPAAPPPSVASENVARSAQEQADALRRKRGRSSTVVTGPEGVGMTPVGTKTLVGS
jgi:hypothetical protein